MPVNLTVVVAAVPALVDALRNTGQFTQVLPVDSTSGLRDLLASGTLSKGTSDKVFIFADSTPVNTEQSLPFLISRLVAMGTPVVIIATSPLGRDLVRQCPGAGLLEGPLKLNQVLGALSGHGGLPTLTPAAPNVDIALPGMSAPVMPSFTSTPAPAAPSPFASAPAPAPANPFGSAPSMPSFAAAPVTERPVTPTPTQQPAISSPQLSPFRANDPEPVNVPAPTGFDTVAPSPFTSPTRAPVAAPEPVAVPSPFAPQYGDPFSAASPAPAPTGGAPASPFTASPFGATPSPFGAPSAGGAYPGSSPASPFAQADPAAGHAQAGGAFGAPVQRVDAPAVARPARRGFVVTITAPKGGTGKSTMSLNLAAYLGLRLRGTGRNVCLIDANVQQADIGKYINAYDTTVEALMKDPSAIHPERINEFLVHRPQYNLSVLLGPSSPEAANPLYFNGKKYSQILEALRPNYDYIIIDTPVAELYHDLFRDFALPQADAIGVVITPNVTTLMNTDSWLQEVTAPLSAGGMGIDPSKVGIVLNRAEDDIGIDEIEVRRELSRWRFLASVPETKEWKRCNNRGELVAPRNYHELNEAFSAVLEAATGEQLVTPGSGLPPTTSKSGRRAWFRLPFGGK